MKMKETKDNISEKSDNHQKNYIIHFRLSEAEYHEVTKRCKESGVASRSDFIRQSILTAYVIPPPPQDLFALRKEAQAIGNNINQIAKVANASGMVSKDQINELLRMQKELIAQIKALF